MEISITGRNITVSDALKEFIKDKISKITRFDNEIHSIDVILSKESRAEKVEIIAHSKSNSYITKSHSSVFEKTIFRALDNLKVRPEFIIVDGNKFKPYNKINHECIIKGDNKFQNIAAASILAKNYRDDLMRNLSIKYNKYSWESNFGYPTKKHRDSIKKYGTTKYHRKSFKLL